MASDTAEADVKVISQDEWNKNIAGIQQEGERFAEDLRRQGKPFKAAILAPKVIAGGAEVTMQAIVIQSDWKAATKLEMVEDANNFLTKANSLGLLNTKLLEGLKAVLEA